MSESPEPPELRRTLQPETDDIQEVLESFWDNLTKQCPDALPKDPENQATIKLICFSAMITGIDWSMTQSPRSLARMLQALRAEDVE